MSNLAFLGLGRMGAPMAARLVGAGHVVSVWNRTPRPGITPAGATFCPSPALAVRTAEIIVTMLADGAALEAVMTGESGVLSAAAPGAVVVDMSTIGPERARHAAGLCASQRLRFIDAPVSGSIPAAQAGTLLAMVGGEAADLEAALPALSAMTSHQLHLGPVGAGATMKLAINLMLAVTNEALAETLTLVQSAGIPSALAYDAIAASAVGSPYVGYKRGAFLEPDAAPVAFSVDLMRKDLRLALELCSGFGVQTPAGRSTAGVLDDTAEAGFGDADLVAVQQTLRPTPE